MADCKRCGRDIEDPKTITCSRQNLRYRDDMYVQRLPNPKNEKERCPLCHIMPEAVSTEKAAIRRDVPDADEDLHYAHTLSNKTPLVTVGGGCLDQSGC
jgi:hypothetical protein